MARPAVADQTPAVFLDRDKVLVADLGYVFRVADLVILSGVPAALSALRKAGFKLIIVSNQSGIARGYYTEDDAHRFNAELLKQLAAQGGAIDDVFMCPHHPDGLPGPLKQNCRCRKPAPGMVLDAAARHNIDLARSFLIGDRDSDIECAVNAGVRGVQIIEANEKVHPKAHAVARSLSEAAQLILQKT